MPDVCGYFTLQARLEKISAAHKTQAGLSSTTDKRHSIDRPGSIALNLKSNPARVQNLRTPPEEIMCADFGTLDSSAVRELRLRHLAIKEDSDPFTRQHVSRPNSVV